jgi:ATP-binding cassette, subfamily B, bacterial MsbA
LIQMTRRFLLVTVALLLPLTVWLVLGHLSAVKELTRAAENRVLFRADRVAADLALRLALLDGIAAKLSVEGIRAAHPDAATAIDPAAAEDGPTVRLESDAGHGLVAVIRVGRDERGVRTMRVPLGVFVPERDESSPTNLLVVGPDGRVLHGDKPVAGKPLVEQDRRKLSSLAVRAVADGDERGVARYHDLEDEDVIGAWSPVEGAGGVVAEERVDVALSPVVGARPWHFVVGLLVLVLIPLTLLEIGTRWPAARSLLRMYAFARPYWKLIVFVIVAMGLYAVGSGAQLVLIKVLVEDVLLSSDPDAAWSVLVLISVTMCVIVVVMALAHYVHMYLTIKVTQSVINDIRLAVGAHLLRLSLGFFHRRRQGELLSRLTNDVGQSRKSLRLIFGDMVQEPLMLAGAVAAGFATNWRLALMIFFAFPLLIYPILRFGQKIKRYARKRQTKRADVTNVMVQMLSGVRIVKAFRMEEHEEGRLREANRQLLKKSLKVARTRALSETILEVFNHIGAVVIMLAGGYFVLHNLFEITVADLVTFSAILTRMYKPLKGLTKAYNRIQDSLPGIERVLELLDIEPEIEDRPDAIPLGKPAKAITFENVSFAYDEESVLRDISVEIPVGSIVALVGPTGAGKSTLTDLVARYYDPGEGRILIDDVDLRAFAVESLLSRIAVVTQEPFLFHATIRENILYGRPDADQEEVEAAARAAFVHGEILEQPDGYDTVVGDRGARLSGGQRQRVTIARAILKDADILILDEATSSLDSRSEGEVQEALGSLMSGRTTFVVAHRLSTIRNADMILVLDRGRIVESGSHDDLVEKNGLYATLHAMQEDGAKNGEG